MLILESLCVSLPSIAIRWDYFRGVRLQTNTIKHHKKKDSVFKLSENGSIKCQSSQWTFYWINYKHLCKFIKLIIIITSISNFLLISNAAFFVELWAICSKDLGSTWQGFGSILQNFGKASLVWSAWPRNLGFWPKVFC